MSVSFYCPCGFRADNFDAIDAHTEPLPGGCCNCGGQRCMSCVFREMHDACVDDCPMCCKADQ